MTEELSAEETPDPAEDHREDQAEEPADEPAEEPAEEAAGTTEAVTTGHPAVDEVLRSLDALGDAPVDEHVAVFEQAHEQLRRTLQGAGDDE